MSVPPLTNRRKCSCSIITQVEVWGHVERGREKEVLGKSQLQRALLRGLGKIDIPAGALGRSSGRLCGLCQHVPVQPQMPFSDDACAVFTILEKAGDCFSLRIHYRAIGWEKDASLQPGAPVVSTGQDSISSWSAYGRGGMSVGKAHAFCTKPVKIGSRDLTPGMGYIAVAHIVSENEDKIRASLGYDGSDESGNRGEKN